MEKQYFVVEFGHSIEGRAKRVRVTYKSLAYVFGLFVVLGLTGFGLLSSYVRMSWKVSNYNELRANFDRLRVRYQDLQRQSRQHNEQMASLETLASEVSVAYGIHQPGAASSREMRQIDTSLAPTMKESVEEYNFLKAASFGGIYHRYAYRWQIHNQPSLWPMNGVLRSPFGARSDPFSGEGAFHTGLDIAAPLGTPVHVSADGVVLTTTWAGAYGKLVTVDHGNGIQTLYAHLSQFEVVPGEEVRRGQIIAMSGATGRATGPHMHYEVRVAGTPVNPYKYLAKQQLTQSASSKRVQSDLGL